MPHYEQVFGNVFERRESKCCRVLMKYCRKAKGEQVITLQMTQQLKTKNIVKAIMQEKLKTSSHSKQIQILTLVPDKWPRMYCSEYFNGFEYLVWTSHEIKKVGGILAKPAPRKGKTNTTESLHLVTNVYEDDNFSR